ncbi:MAG: polyphenol oxidase family protein [Longimicrobiales bacterium]
MVRETAAAGPPALVHPLWAEGLPWLVQGTTVRGDGPEPFDLGLFSDASPARTVLASWERLRRDTGVLRVVHAHQVHGAAVRMHGAGPPGLCLAEPCDGHVTATALTLLAVTVADCVPVSVVDPQRRAVALLHAGWRGAAAGIVERGLAVLQERLGSRPADLLVHLGPAICGRCYEVGPEVFRGLGLPEPGAPAPVDLRAVLAHRAVAAGVAAGSISVSAYCTLCGDAGLFSHRGGDRARQVGYLGVRG